METQLLWAHCRIQGIQGTPDPSLPSDSPPRDPVTSQGALDTQGHSLKAALGDKVNRLAWQPCVLSPLFLSNLWPNQNQPEVC